MTVILDGEHVIMQPIYLLQIDLNDFFLFLDGRGELILFSLLPLCFFSGNLIWVNWDFDALVHKLWFSLEELASQLIIFFFMLIIQSWEGLEAHSVCLTAPVEPLLWELITILVDDTQGNIVICFDAADSSPEK